MPPGKLKWAGRAWAEGTLDDEGAPNELEEDAAFFGIEDFQIGPDEAGVWPEHAEAVSAFLSVQTQWRWVSPGPGALMASGLDYTAARTGLDAAGFTVTPALWNDLQVIEAGAREALNEVPS